MVCTIPLQINIKRTVKFKLGKERQPTEDQLSIVNNHKLLDLTSKLANVNYNKVVNIIFP